jgi:hypothetical protein
MKRRERKRDNANIKTVSLPLPDAVSTDKNAFSARLHASLYLFIISPWLPRPESERKEEATKVGNFGQ